MLYSFAPELISCSRNSGIRIKLSSAMCELWYTKKHPAVMPRKICLVVELYRQKKTVFVLSLWIIYLSSRLNTFVLVGDWCWAAASDDPSELRSGSELYGLVLLGWRNGWMGALLTPKRLSRVRNHHSVGAIPRASSCLKWHSISPYLGRRLLVLSPTCRIVYRLNRFVGWERVVYIRVNTLCIMYYLGYNTSVYIHFRIARQSLMVSEWNIDVSLPTRCFWIFLCQSTRKVYMPVFMYVCVCGVCLKVVWMYQYIVYL